MRRLILALGLMAGSVQADPTVDAVAKAFDDWRAAQGNPDAVLVVLRDGTEYLRIERGIPAEAPVDIQSNSKAITAQCVKALVDEGRLSWDMQLSEVLDTASPLSVAELVIHTSGLWPDSTQKAMPGWRGDMTPRWAQVTAQALARPGGARAEYRYNNENYAILGAVIEAVTGEPYVAACADRVLAPLGITAGLSPLVGSYGPWGGWHMSALDYARFHHASFAGTDPTETPLAALGGGAGYGLGMLSRPDGAGHNFWHFGRLCYGRGAGNGGSYAVNWGTEWTVVAEYRTCVEDAAMGALDRAMIETVLLAP